VLYTADGDTGLGETPGYHSPGVFLRVADGYKQRQFILDRDTVPLRFHGRPLRRQRLGLNGSRR
jgi:hypothetical protein